MKRVFIALAVFAILALSASAFAHSGPQTGGEPTWEELAASTLDGVSHVEDETVNNPDGAYKGWWFVNLTNNTNVAWSQITIAPGVGDNVAIVKGDGLEDEWGFIGNSIVWNKPGNMAYSIVRGTGTRTYTTTMGNVVGELWGQAVFTFTNALQPGDKIGFKIYTDNSWYGEPYATSYSMTLTPTAVPEPSSLAALATGLVGLAGFIRRKRS